MKITVTYKSIDGFRKSGSFMNLTRAQEFAAKWVGQTPELSVAFGCAVSADGIGKVECHGCAIGELFPALDADRCANCGESFAVGSANSVRHFCGECMTTRGDALPDYEEGPSYTRYRPGPPNPSDWMYEDRHFW